MAWLWAVEGYAIVESVVSKYVIAVNGREFLVEVGDVSTSPVRVVVNGESKTVEFKETTRSSVARAQVDAVPEPEPTPKPALAPATVATVPVSGEGHAVKAPMPGKILSIVVAVGDPVSEGDTVCTLEAMKMEMPITSTASGIVRGIHANVGDNVAYDDPLVTVG